MKKIPVLASLIIGGILMTAGCAKQPTPEPIETIAPSVIDYKYQDETKTYVTFSDDRENRIDVSSYVTNYASGDLSLTEAGMKEVFGMDKITASEDEIKLFMQYENENNFADATGDVVKFTTGEHTMFFREGSTLTLMDGEIRNLTEPALKTSSGELSLPIFDIAFGLGYESIGTSVSNDVLTYIIYLPSEPSDTTGPTIDPASIAGGSSDTDAAEPAESAENADETIEILESTDAALESVSEESETAEDVESVSEESSEAESVSEEDALTDETKEN